MLADPEPLCSALMASEERAQDSSLLGSLSALGGNLVCMKMLAYAGAILVPMMSESIFSTFAAGRSGLGYSLAIS